MTVLVVARESTHWSLTLNRPDKHNALSAELVEALIAAFDEAEAAGVEVVMLAGAGRCFSAGFDMQDVAQQSDGDLLLRFVRVETLLQRVASSPCVTLACAHGRNFGAGVDLIAACTERVAAPDSTFRMPGLQFGLVLGTRRFARRVGAANARRILQTAQTFDAQRAMQIGFVDALSAQPQWPEALADTLARAAALPVASRRLLARALDDETADADLAALVHSASVPGLGQRIAAYLRPAS